MELPEGLQLPDYEIVRQKITGFIYEYIQNTRLEGVVLGLSAGIDSSLVATLAVQAIGPDGVHGIIMPTKVTDDSENVEDAKMLAETLGISVEIIEIGPILERYSGMNLEGLALGNLKARIRMTILYARANQKHRLVIGTGNKSELMTGYFTKYGDGGVDLLPIADLYKADVRGLSRHVGVPQKIIDKVPTAGLFPGQTDEGEMGVSYEELDTVLFLKYENGLPDSEIERYGIELEKIDRVTDLYSRSQHKREPVPILKLR
jgi:NAD+ synthase